jgi:hypothetical protein
VLTAILSTLGAAQAIGFPPADVCRAIAADTPIEIEVVDQIDSSKARIGDHFAIRVAAALIVDGKTLIPAGTPGVGEIIHAQRKNHMTGRPGELLIAARYLDLAGTRLPLHGFRIAKTGSAGLTYAPLGSYAYDTQIPAGSQATAKLAGGCAALLPSANAQDVQK